MDRIFPAFGRKSDLFRLAYANHGYMITDDSDFVNLFLQISRKIFVDNGNALRYNVSKLNDSILKHLKGG